MQVVNRHMFTSLASLVLPDGSFKPFFDLPAALLADSTWTPALYAVLCDAVAAQTDQDQRAREASASGQRQLPQRTLAAVIGPRM
eukprot:2914702-Rhodomonas_salina.1